MISKGSQHWAYPRAHGRTDRPTPTQLTPPQLKKTQDAIPQADSVSSSGRQQGQKNRVQGRSSCTSNCGAAAHSAPVQVKSGVPSCVQRARAAASSATTHRASVNQPMQHPRPHVEPHPRGLLLYSPRTPTQCIQPACRAHPLRVG